LREFHAKGVRITQEEGQTMGQIRVFRPKTRLVLAMLEKQAL